MALGGRGAVSRLIVPVSCAAACLALLAMSAPAAAAPARITGKLKVSGYTVIALATNGRVSAVRVPTAEFKLRPPASRVTLHLRDPDGVYAGPVVLGSREKGSRAILGVKAGAQLGDITVDAAGGYAKVARKPAKGAVDSALLGRARKGVPIGSGNFGRVRSKVPSKRIPGDLDFDGLPDRVDIDDDGDRVLDKQDRSSRTRAAQVTPGDPLGLSTGMGVTLSQTPNVQAGASDAQIETALQDLGYMLVNIPFGIDAIELDCGAPVPAGLSYCAQGGTGMAGDPATDPFPGCCDADDDGFGRMVPSTVVPGDFQNFALDHRANTGQIGTGDVLIGHVASSGDVSDCPPPGGVSSNCTSFSSVQQYVFATVPALRTFDDGAGGPVTIPYPVPAGDPGTTEQNPYVVSATGGDVILAVTVSRTQRRPTSEAECAQPSPTCTGTEWIDMGGLVHNVTAGPPGTGHAAECPQGAYSSTDPNLVAHSLHEGFGGFVDRNADQPTGAGNTFSYSVNLTRCLATAGISFNPGQTREVKFQAWTEATAGSAGVDNSHQAISFRRAP